MSGEDTATAGIRNRRPAKTSDLTSVDRNLLEKMTDPESLEHRYIRNIVGPFDAKELTRAVENPGSDRRELGAMIGAAAAAKDSRFRYLLERDELRGDEKIRPYLLAYDYAVNGNEAALNELLEQHRQRQGGGWDDVEVSALACVDEWDKTRLAFSARVLSGDGTGADERYSFWLARRYRFTGSSSFPKDYGAFQEDLQGLWAALPDAAAK
ncbi:MAG: hypothetical protein QM755_17140 [Luteolibacter sp.]